MRPVLLIAVLAGCVPADEAPSVGSVEFHLGPSARTRGGLRGEETEDRYAIRFDRVVLGFKTMTVGKIGVSDLCSFRGRGARSDVVFDPRRDILTQAFNGLQQVDCPDVGVILGAPGGATTLGDGSSARDLLDLATGQPAHAIVEATATRASPSVDGRRREVKIALRFDPTTTGSRFGGCREAARGVRIIAGRRDRADVIFAAENLFRDAISTTSPLRVAPLVDADEANDGDGVVTMADLDLYRLSRIGTGTYQMPTGTRGAFTLGDFVRVLFRFTFLFRTEDGLCIGNGPGEGEDEDRGGG